MGDGQEDTTGSSKDTTDGPINASPAKSFFIRTLTKDIDLPGAILDLIDNSIDSYIENGLTDRRKVVINFSKNQFVISDNCGGIKKTQVYDHTFRFGKLSESRGQTIGTYGIGLKRAILKMGDNITIESDDGTERYSVLIDKKWLDDEFNWNLDFKTQKLPSTNPSTSITITNIFSGISEEFTSTYFQNGLIDRIRGTYSIFIEEFIDIIVNDLKIKSYHFKFLQEKGKFEPFHKKYKDGNVNVEIFAGFTPDNETYGWYVFCNKRLIIQKDTTWSTGWGGEVGTNYHYSEDNWFLGLVFFSSDNAMFLPWSSSKDRIQLDSKVYKTAQIEMRVVTKRLTNFISSLYSTIDPQTSETIGSSIFRDVLTIEKKAIVIESKDVVPIIKGERISNEDLPQYTSINYQVKKNLIAKVKKKLGDVYMFNKKVGEKTFNYYCKLEDIKDE